MPRRANSKAVSKPEDDVPTTSALLPTYSAEFVWAVECLMTPSNVFMPLIWGSMAAPKSEVAHTTGKGSKTKAGQDEEPRRGRGSARGGGRTVLRLQDALLATADDAERPVLVVVGGLLDGRARPDLEVERLDVVLEPVAELGGRAVDLAEEGKECVSQRFRTALPGTQGGRTGQLGGNGM